MPIPPLSDILPPLTKRQGALYSLTFVAIITFGALGCFMEWQKQYSQLILSLSLDLCSFTGFAVYFGVQTTAGLPTFLDKLALAAFKAGDFAIVNGSLREADLPLVDRSLRSFIT